MNASEGRWFCDGFEDGFFDQWELTSLDQLAAHPVESALGQELRQSLSSECYTSYPLHEPHAGAERPKKVLKTSSWGSCTTEQNSTPTLAVADAASSSPTILSFGNLETSSERYNFYGNLVEAVKPKKEVALVFDSGSKRNYDAMVGQELKGVSTRSRSAPHNKEHILAERKRREKLSQRFIALSAIVPGLKKMDKASVLSDAIKYLKHLQEKVNTLEDQAAKKTVESAVLVKKSHLRADDESSSCDENLDTDQYGTFLPEIEAKMSDKNILVKIHCENGKGVLVKALSEIEKLHLTVLNTSVIPFASSSVDITVMAQIEDEFTMTVKEFVQRLNSTFRHFM